MLMDDIKSFLAECVFYPCSELHGLPVKLLSHDYPRFFYADYAIDREQFNQATRGDGFKGYRLAKTVELTPEKVFGKGWDALVQECEIVWPQLAAEWHDPFVVLCRFEREDGLDDSHGPSTFELLFARCEAIVCFKEAFSRRKIAPKCLVHIRSGIAFGGNRHDYPKHLNKALLANSGGLPPLMLCDRMGSDQKYGDYLSLLERYVECKRWGYPDGGFLKLAKLRARADQQGPSAD